MRQCTFGHSLTFQTEFMHIVVASRNPVKIAAVESAFRQVFPDSAWTIEGISVPSGVADQPMSDEETLTGARNRVAAARREKPEADYWAGVEGGIMETEGHLEAFAWMVVENATQTGLGRSAGFMLPPKVAELVRSGIELGIADDMVFGSANSKQSNGAIGLLTGDLITRQTLYEPALIMALIPFLRPELYPPSAGETPEKRQ